jgi:hypothetical protein
MRAARAAGGHDAENRRHRTSQAGAAHRGKGDFRRIWLPNADASAIPAECPPCYPARPAGPGSSRCLSPRRYPPARTPFFLSYGPSRPTFGPGFQRPRVRSGKFPSRRPRAQGNAPAVGTAVAP